MNPIADMEPVLAESLGDRVLHERFLIDRAARESEIVAMLALSPFVRGDEPWMAKFRVDAEVAPLDILPDGAEIDRWVETSWSVTAPSPASVRPERAPGWRRGGACAAGPDRGSPRPRRR